MSGSWRGLRPDRACGCDSVVPPAPPQEGCLPNLGAALERSVGGRFFFLPADAAAALQHGERHGWQQCISRQGQSLTRIGPPGATGTKEIRTEPLAYGDFDRQAGKLATRGASRVAHWLLDSRMGLWTGRTFRAMRLRGAATEVWAFVTARWRYRVVACAGGRWRSREVCKPAQVSGPRGRCAAGSAARRAARGLAGQAGSTVNGPAGYNLLRALRTAAGRPASACRRLGCARLRTSRRRRKKSRRRSRVDAIACHRVARPDAPPAPPMPNTSHAGPARHRSALKRAPTGIGRDHVRAPERAFGAASYPPLPSPSVVDISTCTPSSPTYDIGDRAAHKVVAPERVTRTHPP